MRVQRTCLVLLAAAFVASHAAYAIEPVSVIQLAKPGNGWATVEYDDLQPSEPWHFDVYANAESHDLLSFAARRVETKEPRGLIFWSDSVREIFPIGHPAWSTSAKRYTTGNTIKNGVVDVKVFDPDKRENISQEMLEYTLVVEVPKQKNRMVQGYAFIFDGVFVIVQQTSVNPITSELARTTAKSLIKKCRSGAL